MPNGIGKGDGDPGSHSSHFGYLESYDITKPPDTADFKAYRRTGPKGHRLQIGKQCEFKLSRYYCIEMPANVTPGNGLNDPPWIHIAHLMTEESTDPCGSAVRNLSDEDLNIQPNDPGEDHDNGSSIEDTIQNLRDLITELEG